MQIVIDIPEEDYQLMKDGHIPFKMLDVIMSGTPLPKGHGRLIDADELKAKMHMDGYTGFATYHDVAKCFDYINDAPTIIEAYKGEREDKR